jgi:glycolate oxidase FAD binding subunit
MDNDLNPIVERIRAAANDQTPLRIRGGGSKDFYGQSLQGEILDTRGLGGIVSYQPSELVVTVRSGTPLADLESVLREQGQYLPFEPPGFISSGAQATCGGMVAAGLNGPSRASVGAVRDYVLGVTLLNGRAELLKFGGEVMKNVAGYDVSRLIAGSLGTLGLIVQVSLKVLPIAPAQCTLFFELDEAQALAQLNRWAGLPLPVNASCWFDGALMVRLRGAKAAVAAAQVAMGGQLMAVADEERLWNGLREQTAPFFVLRENESLVRLSVPDTTPPLNLGPTLIEWGGAQRWIKTLGSQGPEIRAALAPVGGQHTLFRSANKASGVFSALPSPLDRIHRQLKKQFDPADIFNPGRMYPDF